MVASRGAYTARRREVLQRERRVGGGDPLVRDRILDRLLPGDRWLAKFDEIMRVCDAATETGAGIRCPSD